jgi:hypothetical protein
VSKFGTRIGELVQNLSSVLCYHNQIECCELAWSLSLIEEYPDTVLALNPRCLCLAIRKQAKDVECNDQPSALCVSVSTATVVESRE